MKRKILFLIIISIFTSGFLFAQQDETATESRVEQIHTLLDYRFRGGFYSFERLFNKTVKYPDMARTNCEIGTMLARFTVDCQGEVKNIRIENPLGYGLEKVLSKFLKSTQGQWNECKNDRFTHFAIPIQFTLEGTKTDSIYPAISFVGDNPGYACPDDSYYLKKAKEALKKGRKKRAQTYLETLIRRNPFDKSYYKLLKETVDKKDKAKKKKNKSRKKH